MNSNQIVLPTIMNPSEDNGIGIYMTPSLTISTTNMSTFKTINPLPSKPSDVKRRSNNRKQIYAALSFNNNNNSSIIIENETSGPPPPPPPPFPINFDSINKPERQTPIAPQKTPKVESISTNDFQIQIEQAKTRLKKINGETSSKTIKPMHQNTSGKYF
jgi:hypothetical protein